MIEYKGITVYKEKDRIIVEFDSNTIKLFGATMEDAAIFTRILLEEDS